MTETGGNAIHPVLKRVRAAAGTALVWSTAWFAGALALFTALKVTGFITATWADALLNAVRAGIVGGITGVAFAGVVGLMYRGLRLSDMNWIRFGIGGALLTGIFVPLFLQTMNLLSGDGLVPWRLVLDDGIWTAAFGGIAAGGSLRLAQHAEKRLRSGSDSDRDAIGSD